MWLLHRFLHRLRVLSGWSHTNTPYGGAFLANKAWSWSRFRIWEKCHTNLGPIWRGSGDSGFGYCSNTMEEPPNPQIPGPFPFARWFWLETEPSGSSLQGNRGMHSAVAQGARAELCQTLPYFTKQALATHGAYTEERCAGAKRVLNLAKPCVSSYFKLTMPL